MHTRLLTTVILAALLALAGCAGVALPGQDATPDDRADGSSAGPRSAEGPGDGAGRGAGDDGRALRDAGTGLVGGSSGPGGPGTHGGPTAPDAAADAAGSTTSGPSPAPGGFGDAASGPNVVERFDRLTVSVVALRFRQTDGEWVTFDAVNQTVDLSELDGRRAELVDSSRLPAGQYDRVRLVVGSIDGRIDGRSVPVVLEGDRLEVRERFRGGGAGRVAFDFSVTVRDVGWAYRLEPSIGGEPTDGLPMGEVKRQVHDPPPADVDVEVEGGAEPGSTLRVRVTRDGYPLSGAPVRIGDERRETDVNGTVTYEVPPDAAALSVTVAVGEERLAIERTYDETDAAGSD